MLESGLWVEPMLNHHVFDIELPDDQCDYCNLVALRQLARERKEPINIQALPTGETRIYMERKEVMHTTEYPTSCTCEGMVW